MTRQRVHGVRCQHCGAEDMRCSKCGEILSPASPFSDWLRQLKAPLDSGNIDNENLDHVWFHYQDPAWYITIEEKMFGACSRPAQRDTFNILAQHLKLGSVVPVDTMRDKRIVEYRGHYEIAFEKTSPEDSTWVRVNGVMQPISAVDELLRTGTFTLVKNFSPVRSLAKPIVANELEQITAHWNEVLIALRQRNHQVRALANAVYPVSCDGRKILLGVEADFHCEKFDDPRRRTVMADAIAQVMKKRYALEFTVRPACGIG